jgi:hypothetical protein
MQNLINGSYQNCRVSKCWFSAVYFKVRQFGWSALYLSLVYSQAVNQATKISKAVIPGVPGILTFIDKNIEPLFFGFAKKNSAVDNSKKLRHKHKITPRG